MIETTVFAMCMAGLFFGAFMIYMSLLRYKRGELTNKSFAVFMSVWISFIILSLKPGLLDPLIDMVHFNRRLDFFIVLGFIFLLLICFYVFTTVVGINKKIEDLTREMSYIKEEKK